MNLLTKKIYHLLLVLPLVLLSSGFSASPIEGSENGPQVPPEEFDLMTESSGWILLNGHLFWTPDAGSSWAEIGPSIPAGAVVQDVEFIDFNTGWMLWAAINPDGSSSFTLAHTSDHGAVWNTAALSLFEAGELAAHSERADMGWLDSQNGWIAVKQFSSSNFSLGTLFTTSDGGSTWTRSDLPVADQVVFSDHQTGWAVGGPAGDQLLITRDGGNTWQSDKPGLPSDSSVMIYQPHFAGEQAGLVATGLDVENNLTLYVFDGSSGGWVPLEQVTVGAQSGSMGLSMIDARNLVAVIPGTESVIVMRDGVFEVLLNQDGRSASITDLDMVSLETGWGKSVESKCVTASLPDNEPVSVSCSSSPRLLRTEDGGMTWMDIQLPLMPSNVAPESAGQSGSSLAMNSLAHTGNTELFIGQGFDKCEIPTISQLQTWSLNSPYKAVNLYIGGSSRSCLNSALTTSFLEQTRRQGWRFIPTWVGPQAPCTGYRSRMSSDLVTAFDQGVSEANLAVDRLAELGLTYPDKTGSVVYYDIENYGTNTACREAVKAFMNGWVSRLHARGNLAGVYGSTLCNTGLSDFLTISNVPDAIWPARWYHNIGEGYYDPAASVWNLGSCVPNTVWTNHQRIRQYEGDHDETWGNLTLGIDSNVLDGVVAIPFPDPARLSFQEIAQGLSNPVFIANAGDGSGRLFILERSGRIRIIKNGDVLAVPFLDIRSAVKSTGGEQGLLGLAFHPSYEENGKFYVAYTAPRPGDSNGSILTLMQYSVSTDNPDVADPASGATILTIDHPSYSNHNGGTLAFGSDGYLYWSTGDGGGAGDPNNHAQDLTTLLGKILRIDVNSGLPYSVPADNPFLGSPDPGIKEEIWAYGLRNPWRMSFDRLTHDLYIGDVGQGAREEIDFQPSDSAGGENYGWRVMEGSLCYDPSSGCDRTGKVLPVAEYDHALGCSVTGGYVYRGQAFPTLSGYYLYGDYCSGRIFGVYRNSPTDWSTPVQLADTAFTITTFGEDELGEMYLADYSAGRIYRIQYGEPYLTIRGNAGAAGVTLSYTDGTSRTATSRSDGSYSLQVSVGWSGTVTPSHACYTFNPASRTYNNVMADQAAEDYTAVYNPAAGCTSVNVTIGGASKGNYGVPPQEGLRLGYTGVDNGPVKVTGQNGELIIASERINLKTNETYGSYAEVMGLPASKLSDTYIFPWYNNTGFLDSQLRFANVGNANTVVTIKINGVVQPTTYPLAPNQGARVTYVGVDNGPVEVRSSNGVPIISAMRINLKVNSPYTSYSEFLGLSASSTASTRYVFPWYNNTGLLDSQLRFANVGNTTTTVTIKIGGVTQPVTYTLAPSQSTRVTYPSLDGGPVEVTSSGNVPITAAMRINLKNNTAYTSYTELMGLTGASLTDTRYLFPWYNNTGSLDSQLRFANVGNANTTVSIKINGVVQPTTYALRPNESTRVSLAGVDNGPVEVYSSGEPIIAALRIDLKASPSYDSYYEFMGMSVGAPLGLPTNQLSSTYWFPWYNNTGLLDSQLRFGVP